MFRSLCSLLCPDPRSTCVAVQSSPNLCAWRLPRPRRGVGVYPERLGAFGSPLAKSFAETPSASHPTHSGANASLLSSIAPAWQVGPGHAVNPLDFSPCSLREQRETNSRANNAIIFNNLQTNYLLTPVNSYTYKIGGGYFPERINSPSSCPHTSMGPAFQHTLWAARPLSTFNCRLSTLQVQSPRSIQRPELHFGANSTMGDR
jgi:hypothetical protein